MQEFSNISFDLDGTLINTIPSITHALNKTFLEFGFQEIELEMVKNHVGLPVEVLFEHLALNSFQVSELVEVFRFSLRTCLSTSVDVYPGIPQLLKKLTIDGCALSAATSKPTDLAISTLENAGLLEYFNLVVGVDNGRHKPDPWVLAEVQSKFGNNIDLFIGDRIEDAAAAERAVVPFVGVLNSVHLRTDFQAFPHLAIYDDSQDLLRFFYGVN